MALSYVPVDRDQAFLMPPDMSDWLGEDHLAWFVVDTVAAIDTSGFHRGRQLGGVGRRGYDPDMLLALLVYAYANGERSSRRIERLCETDVACRVICANLKPDHTVIARFRAENEEAFRVLFSQVVELCVSAGMAGLGVLAVDGTKVEADASRLSNRTRDQIASEVDRIVDEAKRVDAEEDDVYGEGRGDELASVWVEREGRVERLRRALDQLDSAAAESLEESGTGQRVAKAKTRLERVRAVQQAKVDAYDHEKSEGKRPRGQPPRPVEEYSAVKEARQRLVNAEAAHVRASERAEQTRRGHRRKANTTDPESRLMRSKGAWIQAYNAQAGFSEDGIAVAAGVTNQVSDAGMLHPIIDQARQLTAGDACPGQISAVVADTGYWNENSMPDPEDPDDSQTPMLLVPPRGFNPRDNTDNDPGPPPDNASAAKKMRWRLSSTEGKTLYAKRAAQAEGPFGHLKTRFGFTRFSRRGLTAADSEWHLILAVRNRVKLHQQTATASS